MKLLFLGTGAADWPVDVSGSEEFRRNASALVDAKILIDPGPGVLDAVRCFGVDKSQIKYIINTHRHGDHFCKNTLEQLVAAGAEFIEMKADDEFTLDGYTVRALRAHHGTCAEAVHFLISDGKSRLFYGLDGAWLMYDEVQAIKNAHVDLAVLDATVGNSHGDCRVFEHNNLRMVIEMKASLEAHIGRFVISHMARTLHDDHKTLSEQMNAHGIETAYDGLTVEF
ncbi:MAG: MBL fold metallo-hydrolase [Clostridia bacterium]|nr:MBL fold metallo-hydrolase [Clostridia bacterium]